MKAKKTVIPILIGVAAALVDVWLVSNLWSSLGWRGPVADWISHHGFPRLAVWCSNLWLRLPTFVIAMVLGIVVVRLFRNRWLSSALLCAAGFMGTSLVLMTSMVQLFHHPHKWLVGLRAEAWNAPSVVLLVLVAWYFAPRKKAFAASAEKTGKSKKAGS